LTEFFFWYGDIGQSTVGVREIDCDDIVARGSFDIDITISGGFLTACPTETGWEGWVNRETLVAGSYWDEAKDIIRQSG
jgi:hypothetical protein